MYEQKELEKKTHIIKWFYLLFIASLTVLFGFFIFYQNEREVENLQSQLHNTNMVVDILLSDFLVYNESLMNVVGDKLLSFPMSRADAKAYMELTIEKNPKLLAFGYTTEDGQLQVVTNINLSVPLPNLYAIKEAKNSFTKTLETTNMLIGRTYFMPYLFNGRGAWVVPLRLKVSNGQKFIIVSLGVDPIKPFIDWQETSLLSDFQVYIIRADGYLQFTNNNKVDPHKLFDQPIIDPKKIVNMKLGSMIPFRSFITGEMNYGYVTYNFNLDTYTLISVNEKILTQRQLHNQLHIVFVYLLVILVSSLVFWGIASLSKTYETKLMHQATHDPLTGFPNRYYLMSEIEHRIQHSVSSNSRFVLFFIDLDDFKQINDKYSHQVGDTLLQKVAMVLKNNLRKDDFIARIGGDEFVVIAELRDDVEKSGKRVADDEKHLAEKIKKALNAPIKISDGLTLMVGASIGVVVYPEIKASSANLLKHADIAMYAAKRKGKHSYVIYNEMENKKL